MSQPKSVAELQVLVRLARALLAARHAAAPSGPPVASELVPAALRLAEAVGRDSTLFAELDRALGAEDLAVVVLDLPLALAEQSEPEAAIAIARAFAFLAPDKLLGDVAIILARQGQREAALTQVRENLASPGDASRAEAKAGDTYRALGEEDAAAAYYRRAIEVANDASDRAEAVLRLVSLLVDNGREQQASELIASERARVKANVPAPPPARVGRNDPCPCGSGKKYKKCHGQSA